MRQVQLTQSTGVETAIDAEKVVAVESRGEHSMVHLLGNIHLLVWGDLKTTCDLIWPVEIPI